ncbi:MAG: hypothetical protein R2787_13695 [Saprospiraceae bacterium]
MKALNECGSSDSTCIQVFAGTRDTTMVQLQTCDPLEAGVDTTLWINQTGCDSLAIVERILVPAIEHHLQFSTCDPAQAVVDTIVFKPGRAVTVW